LGSKPVTDHKNNYSTEVTKMSAASLYPVRPEVLANTLTDEATYKAMYQQSVVNPDGFWREQAKRLDWIKPFTTVKQTSFDDHHVDIKWFADGTLNVSYNCLDRHLAERGDQIAIIWEGDDPAESRNITYRELHEQVCKFANALRGQDVHRGDVVTIYMPMIPGAVVAMLACTRIGDRWRRAERAAAPGAEELGAQGDRSDCLAGCHPVGAGAAENPFGQDHAPHSAQDCHGRIRWVGGYLHLGRSGCGAALD
jgi:acetyl-CoA synthetase